MTTSTGTATRTAATRSMSKRRPSGAAGVTAFQAGAAAARRVAVDFEVAVVVAVGVEVGVEVGVGVAVEVG